MRKVKRIRKNWVSILHKVGTVEMFNYFFSKLSTLHRGKFLSSNRCAYATLKHFYSTTTIDELLSKVKITMRDRFVL